MNVFVARRRRSLPLLTRAALIFLISLALFFSTRVYESSGRLQQEGSASGGSSGSSGVGVPRTLGGSQPTGDLDAHNFALWVRATTVTPGKGSGPDAATNGTCLAAPELEWLRRSFDRWSKVGKLAAVFACAAQHLPGWSCRTWDASIYTSCSLLVTNPTRSSTKNGWPALML